MPGILSDVYTALTSSPYICAYLVESILFLFVSYRYQSRDARVLLQNAFQGHPDILALSKSLGVGFLASAVSALLFFSEIVRRLIKVGFFKFIFKFIGRLLMAFLMVIALLLLVCGIVILLLLVKNAEAAKAMQAIVDKMRQTREAQDKVDSAHESALSAEISETESLQSFFAAWAPSTAQSQESLQQPKASRPLQ